MNPQLRQHAMILKRYKHQQHQWIRELTQAADSSD